MDTLQAVVLNVKLNYLDGWTKRRRENADEYRLLFRKSGLVEKAGVVLPEAMYTGTSAVNDHIYNQFVLRVPNRDGLREFLKQEGIGTEVYYPVPFHLQECFRSLGYKEGDFPEAERAAKETVALPIYPELTKQMRQAVVKAIISFYER